MPAPGPLRVASGCWGNDPRLAPAPAAVPGLTADLVARLRPHWLA